VCVCGGGGGSCPWNSIQTGHIYTTATVMVGVALPTDTMELAY
jgi:hypothetical protein